ncbi:MAG: glycosyl transferase family 2 [Parcubacteria group bacterium CG23_combo_of_CG06-09_8_20_14_all_35_9]|nr:MAG: glycosyl transferase family 2 [Parcubacteria group bacterium CG23_combo_of_CG06-09_8_20_14_all_35_9]
MDLSIIILNYKTKGLVKQCIKGIKLLNLELDYEIIVVDNASQDGVGQMIKEQFSEAKFIAGKVNRGYAAGNNLGIRRSKGKYIMILNPDITVLPQAIEKMFSFLESYPKAAVVGPKLINPDGSTQLSCYHFPSLLVPIYRRTPLGRLPFAKKILRWYQMMDWDHSKRRRVDWLLGACLMIRTSAIEKVGLMDERFFLYFEDIDWCRRFWQAGWEVYYIADAEMVHYYQRLSAEGPGIIGLFKKSTRIHIVSWIKYFAKWFRS